MKKYLKKLNLLGLAVIFSALTSCNLGDENPNLEANEALYDYLESWYLWYDKIPAVDPEDYTSPVGLMEAVRYSELDKWSYITTRQELESYYDEGVYVGFGFGSAFDQNGTLWISFVFEDSPLMEHGVGRGWRILTVNNTVPTPENVNELFGSATVGIERVFVFGGSNGESLTRTIMKQVITMNTVLMDSVYTMGATKVGYFVLKGFIGPTVSEINEVFSKFQLQGVSELIVDLRYNSGGELDVAAHLAGQIAGNSSDGQIFSTLVYNDKNQDENSNYLIAVKSNSIVLSRVVFITTGSSASASEVLINGLKPHMGVTLVGSKTYGKPVGMRGAYFNDWAFIPICFRTLNASGEGDYYNGIPVDYTYADGINYSFGDLNENSLYGAINYLTGSLPKSVANGSEKVLSYPMMKGLQAEIGAW